VKTSCASSKPTPRLGLRLSDSLLALLNRNRIAGWYDSYTTSAGGWCNGGGTLGQRRVAGVRDLPTGNIGI